MALCLCLYTVKLVCGSNFIFLFFSGSISDFAKLFLFYKTDVKAIKIGDVVQAFSDLEKVPHTIQLFETFFREICY